MRRWKRSVQPTRITLDEGTSTLAKKSAAVLKEFDTMKRVLLLSALFALATAWPLAAEPGPNFIFINIDDMGYADIGSFGSRLNRTPNLDRMARAPANCSCTKRSNGLSWFSAAIT